MKRKPLLLFAAVLVLLSVALPSFASGPGPGGAGGPIVAWTDIYPGGSKYAISQGIAVGPDGNPVACGLYTEGMGMNQYFMVTKYRAGSGEVMWRKMALTGTGGRCQARGVAVGPDNDPVAVGFCQNADNDIWVRKYDGATGSTLWSKVYSGGAGSDVANAVAIARDGNPIVSGYDTTGGEERAWMRKYSSADGSTVWTTTYDPTTGDEANGVCCDGSGNFYVCGVGAAGGGDDSGFIAKYRDGSPPTFLWVKNTGGSGQHTQYMDIALSGDGNVAATGMQEYGSKDQAITLCRRGSDGSLAWTDRYIASYDRAMAKGIACNGSGNIFVTGSVESGGSYSLVLRQLESDGAPVWTSRYTDRLGGGFGIALDLPGNAYISGVTAGEDKQEVSLVLKYITADPIVSSITPTSGPVGAAVTVKGSNFGPERASSLSGGSAGSFVTFNGAQATGYASWSNTEIKCVVPPGADTGPVEVTTTVGSSNDKVEFKVTKPSWYLAEGSTAWGFSTYMTIENPSGRALNADITYMTTDGPVDGGQVGLPAESQVTVNPRDVLGDRDFSTFVDCLQGSTIAVDRTMTWTGPGAPSQEAHNSIGVTAPATRWYLAEGSSAWGFECWLLIQNPNDREATCEVTYMIEGAAPVVKEKKVPANSRATYNMESDIGQKDASIMVESDRPVIPERAMYRNSRREGHGSIGTLAAASDYYLAEGTTAWGFTTYVLVQNPNSSPNDVEVTFMTPQGPRSLPGFTMPANSRETIRVNDYFPGTDLSTKVHGSGPVIAERAMYWNGGAAGELGEACHDSIGMSAPHTTFLFPDGQAGGGYETWTLVQNHNSTDVKIEVSYLKAGGGKVTLTDTIPAQSRKTYGMGDAGIDGRAAVKVRCLTAGRKVMAERAMYWNNRGAGTDTIGGYSD